MFWMIVLAVATSGGEQVKLMADPLVAFTSEEKCTDAIKVLQRIKTSAPLQCVSFEVIGGVPLEVY